MRDPLNVAVAVVMVLLVAVGGMRLMERWHPAGEAVAIPATHKRVTLEVGGMMCGNCAIKVSDQLQATAGVSGCEMDPEHKRAVVECDRAVPESTLVAAVRSAGSEYSARVVGH